MWDLSSKDPFEVVTRPIDNQRATCAYPNSLRSSEGGQVAIERESRRGECVRDADLRESANAMTVRRLLFDPTAYSVDAVQRAAYRFSDRASAEIRAQGEDIECTLTCFDCEDGSGHERIDALVADFRTEVLDQVLRARIRAETEAVRNMILALAFSETGLVNE
jgi:His-Xaa-Ser system protein HxsD